MCEETIRDAEEPRIDHQFDPARTPPVEAVLRAVSRVDDIDLTRATPLAHVVDPDALDALLAHPLDTDSVTVCFLYEGLEITMTSEGTVSVADAPER